MAVQCLKGVRYCVIQPFKESASCKVHVVAILLIGLIAAGCVAWGGDYLIPGYLCGGISAALALLLVTCVKKRPVILPEPINWLPEEQLAMIQREGALNNELLRFMMRNRNEMQYHGKFNAFVGEFLKTASITSLSDLHNKDYFTHLIVRTIMRLGGLEIPHLHKLMVLECSYWLKMQKDPKGLDSLVSKLTEERFQELERVVQGANYIDRVQVKANDLIKEILSRTQS